MHSEACAKWTSRTQFRSFTFYCKWWSGEWQRRRPKQLRQKHYHLHFYSVLLSVSRRNKFRTKIKTVLQLILLEASTRRKLANYPSQTTAPNRYRHSFTTNFQVEEIIIICIRISSAGRIKSEILFAGPSASLLASHVSVWVWEKPARCDAL